MISTANLTGIDAGVLRVGYLESGPQKGWPVVLSHGFLFDIHAYDEVAPTLASHGARVITPYLRGSGPTRFLSPDTMRSGQQAALGSDLLALLNALQLKTAILAGYDWGGLASWLSRRCSLSGSRASFLWQVTPSST